MKQASCVLIPGNEDRVISISRRNNYTQWGLPGGKVDAGEPSVEAAQRELKEEIGLQVLQNQLVPLFCDVCPGDATFWVTTYLFTGHNVTLEKLRVEQGFAIGWKSLNQLADRHVSPFAEYNVKVAHAYQTYLKGSQ